MNAPHAAAAYAIVPYPGGPYMVGDSTIFPVAINDTFMPELAESPAKLTNAGYLPRGIQHAHPSRLRNVLHKLSDIPGMGQILMHYLLVDRICEDKEEDYERYKGDLHIASAMPQQNATSVKQTLNESHMRRATKRMAGGPLEVPIVVEDEGDQKETARPSLAPIKSFTGSAATTAIHYQQAEVFATRCLQTVEEVFDAEEAGDGLEICLYHPGELEADDDMFEDFDENCHAEEPDIFIGTCCKARGDKEGCTEGHDREMEGQRRRMF